MTHLASHVSHHRQTYTLSCQQKSLHFCLPSPTAPGVFVGDARERFFATSRHTGTALCDHRSMSSISSSRQMSRSSRYTSLSRFVEVEYAHDVEEKEASAIRLPVGIRFVQKCIGRRIGYDAHKYLVFRYHFSHIIQRLSILQALVLTFLIYATYHASRRPLNVVKP